MDTRERIVAALRGHMPDRVPWTVYAGFLAQGTFERRLRSQGLGLVRHTAVCSAERPNVQLAERTVRENGESVVIRTYRTPVGELSERRRTEPGYNSSWAIEHFVKEPADYEVVEFIIRDATYLPDPVAFARAERDMGVDGLVATAVHRIPFQSLWVEWTGLDRLMLDLHDFPDRVNGVLTAMVEKDREMWAIVADSRAEFVWCPDNVSGTIVGPRLFRRYFTPYYHDLAAVLHPRGKLIYAHMDGLMRPLLEEVAELPVDIVEAFTPAPMGDVSVAEARKAWPGKVIWINFPSSVHVEPPAVVRQVTLDLLKEAAPGDGFLVGVTENIPDEFIAPSLTAITDAIAEYGECPVLG